MPSTSSSAGYSTSFSKSSNQIAVGSPQIIVADLKVRPDLLAMNYAMRQEAPTPQEAIAKLKDRFVALHGLVKAQLGDAASMRPCGFETSGSTKKWVATANGAIELKLDGDLDYWARATLLAKMKTLAGVEQKPHPDNDKPDASITTGFSAPALMVRDPEVHRSALTQRWVLRARAFAAAASADGAPLRLEDCDPPPAIGQQTVTLEEVALTASFRCRLRTGSGPQPDAS